MYLTKYRYNRSGCGDSGAAHVERKVEKMSLIWGTGWLPDRLLHRLSPSFFYVLGEDVDTHSNRIWETQASGC